MEIFTQYAKEGIFNDNIYAILYGNANKLGYAYGSNKYYAKLLKCSERTISSCIKILKDNNLIRISNPRSFRRKINIVTE